MQRSMTFDKTPPQLDVTTPAVMGTAEDQKVLGAQGTLAANRIAQSAPNATGDWLGAFAAKIVQCGDPQRLPTEVVRLAIAFINRVPGSPFADADAPAVRHNLQEIEIFVGEPEEVEKFLTARYPANDSHARFAGTLWDWENVEGGGAGGTVPGPDGKPLQYRSFKGTGGGASYRPGKEQRDAGGERRRFNFVMIAPSAYTNLLDRPMTSRIYSMGLLLAHEANHTITEVGHSSRAYDDHEESLGATPADVDAFLVRAGLSADQRGEVQQQVLRAFAANVQDDGGELGGYNARRGLGELDVKLRAVGVAEDTITIILSRLFEHHVQHTCNVKNTVGAW